MQGFCQSYLASADVVIVGSRTESSGRKDNSLSLLLRRLSRHRFGWSIGRNHNAGGRLFAVDELESRKGAAVGEQLLSCSENQRVDGEYVFVDEIVLHQRPYQFATAED